MGLEDFDIEFVGLKNGTHHFRYRIDDAFFALFEKSPVQGGNVELEVTFEKDNHLFQLHFDFTGTLTVNCDRCLTEIAYPVDTTFELMVKTVENPADAPDDENITHISPADIKFNIAAPIYDSLVLELPLARYCEDVGKTCDPAVLDKLREMQAHRDEEADPRWDKLKEIFKDN